MKKKGLMATVLLLCLAMLALAGCGGSDSGGATTTPGSSNAPAQTPEGRDRIVRICASFPLQTDPAIGSNSIESAVQFNLYDALVFTGIDGTVIPHVATEWEMSEDGLTYTFKIRNDIKFHDGSLLDAHDVAFSMNRLLAIGQGFSYLWTPYVSEAVATDDYTVEMHLKQTFGPFVSTLVRMAVVNEELVMANLGEGSYGEFGDYGTNYLLTHDAGSGPYMMTEMNTNESMTAVKFDDYWLGWSGNNPETLKVLAVNDTATIRTMMANQELEITDEWQAEESLLALSNIEGITVPRIYSGALVDLEMNTKKEPTDDVHYRKALAYLFDYETAITQIYPGTKQAVGPVSASYEGHDDILYQYYFDIEKAKEELALSKYADTYQDYEIDIVWMSAVPDEEKLSLLLQQACAQVGITLNILKTPYTTATADAANIATTAHITIMYPSDSYGEAGSVLNLRYHSATTGTFQQFEWLQDPQIDAMIDASLSELDKEARLEMYKEIQARLVELCPTIWVLEWAESRAYQSGYLYWPEAEQALAGGTNAPIMGRAVYLRTMEFLE